MNVRVAAAITISFVSASAWAQSPEQAPSETPSPVYTQAQGAPAQVTEPATPPPAQAHHFPPPPAAAEARSGVRLHDGFYLRMSLGLGSGHSTITLTEQGQSEPDYKFSGTAMMFDIMLGGSPVPGWVLGGALVSHRILNPKLTYGGTDLGSPSGDYSVNLLTFGLFTAVYPDPNAGFNIHALVGYGETSFTINNANSTNNPSGLVLMGGLGYDFWIGDQWSLGPDLRIAYAKNSKTSGPEEFKATDFIPTLSFVATYH